MATSSPKHNLRAPEDSDVIDIAGDVSRLRDDVERELADFDVDLTPIENKIKALETAINSLSAHVARHDPVVFRNAKAANTDIRGDTTWRTPSGYSWTWTIPMDGVLLLNGNAELNDQGTLTGDPRARVLFGGSAYIGGGAGIAIAGVKKGSATTVTVPIDGVARLRKGALTVSIQVNMSTTNKTAQIKRGQVSGLFVPTMGAFPPVTVGQFGENVDDSNDDGADGS